MADENPARRVLNAEELERAMIAYRARAVHGDRVAMRGALYALGIEVTDD